MLHIFLSWSIWQALQGKPGIEPLIKKSIAVTEDDHSGIRVPAWLLGIRDFGFMMVFFFACVFQIPLLIGAMSVLFLGGTINGTIISMEIAAAVGRAREKSRYDLMSLIPKGGIGVLWSIGQRTLRHHKTVKTLKRGFEALTILVLFVIGFITVMLFVANLLPQNGTFPELRPLVAVGIILIAIRLDFMLSMQTGLVNGMLISTYIRGRSDGYLYGALVFITLQVGLYVLIFLVGIILPNMIYDQMMPDSQWTPVAVALTLLVVILLVRELALRIIWHQVSVRLNTDADELALLSRRSPA